MGAAGQRCRIFSSDTTEDQGTVTGVSCYSWIVNKSPFAKLQDNTAHAEKIKNQANPVLLYSDSNGQQNTRPGCYSSPSLPWSELFKRRYGKETRRRNQNQQAALNEEVFHHLATNEH